MVIFLENQKFTLSRDFCSCPCPGTREDKTIESAVPFPAPEKGDNQGLSPFHPRMIIVVGECPLLSPVWKSSPLPRKPLKRLENLPPSPSPVTRAGTGKGTPSFNALKEPNFHYFINLTWPTFTAASTVQFAVVILLEKKYTFKVYFCLKNAKKKERGRPGLTLDNIVI